MDDKFRKQVKYFLAGTLDKKDTLSVLDQVKNSEECRRYLEEQTRLSPSRHKPHHAAGTDSQTHRCGSATPPRFAGEVSPRMIKSVLRPGRSPNVRRLLFFGVILATIVFVFNKENNAKPTLNAQQILVAAAIADGSPIATSPQGDCPTRPVTVAVLVPSGNQSIKLIFMANGMSVFEQQYKSTDFGVQMDSKTVPSDTGTLPAVEVILPFPDNKALPLEIGQRYFYFLELPNGRQSAPISIDIR